MENTGWTYNGILIAKDKLKDKDSAPGMFTNLNAYGTAGWELVCVLPLQDGSFYAVMKMPCKQTI